MPAPLGHPPGPIGWPLLGMLPEFRANPAEFLLRVATEYGDMSYFRLGLQRVYLLNRPDLIEEVLVTNQGNFTKSRMLERARSLLGDGLLTAEGSHHIQQRKLVQPSFSAGQIANYARPMAECAERACQRWEAGRVIDIGEQMMRLTLAIAGVTLFGREIEDEADEIGRALTAIVGTFGLMLTPGAGLWSKLPLPVMRRAWRAQKHLDGFIAGVLEQKRSSGGGEDLLSRLLASGAPPGQIRDHALTFLLAGHETTATALTWAWYLLARHPEAEARLREELRTVLGGRTPEYEDLARLDYTSRVFLETLRLYPPAWAIGRRSKNGMRLYNYHLPRHSICVLSPYVTHRHPRFWPEPERFDPDRFLPESAARRPKFAYFPFGGGARACIGDRFALMEGTLLLAVLAQRWRFRLVSPEPVGICPQITLRPRTAVRMAPERA